MSDGKGGLAEWMDKWVEGMKIVCLVGWLVKMVLVGWMDGWMDGWWPLGMLNSFCELK